MLGNVIFASTIKRKRLIEIKPGFYILAQDFNKGYTPSVYTKYKNYYVNCGTTNHINLINEQEIETKVRNKIEEDYKINGKLLTFGYEPYLRVENFDGKYWEEFLRRKLNYSATREINYKVQQAEKLALEEIQHKEHIKKIIDKVSNNLEISNTDFIYLLKHYGIKVHPRTLGSIKKNLLSIKNGEARVHKNCKSNHFFTLYQTLLDKVKRAY